MSVSANRTLMISSLILCPVLWATISQAEPELETGNSAKSRFKFAKMFDFNRFKEIFNKHYNSLENLARQRLFLGRAVRAFVSAIRYKHHDLSYYLSINQMSDWTPEELSRTAMARPANIGEPLSRVEPFPVADLEEIEEKFSDVIARSDEPGYKEMSQELLLKVKPESGTTLSEQEEDRDVSVSDLVFKNEELVDSSEIAESTTISESTMSEDEAEKFTCADTFGFVGLVLKETVRAISTAIAKPFKEAAKQKRLPDKVFIDHRESGCLGRVKSQGQCGSCYIFASITLYEYYYCMATGKQISFSEQYVIDCGFRADTGGCNGGRFISVSEFVNTYGLELSENYQYRFKQDSCPYDKNTPPTVMGYIRSFDKGFRFYRLSDIEKNLKTGPMIMNLRHTYELAEYGGGVHDAKGCWSSDKVHSMVLIGHGREDNQEYWLFRNSHSFIWGERGYYKLSKKADCFDTIFAYTLFGFKLNSRDGLNDNYAGKEPLRKRKMEYELEN